MDPESQAWVASLSSEGRERDDSVERLRALLLRAARFEVQRRRSSLDSSVDVDQLASDAAHDALMAVLAKLGTYRGDSRFTTWAYKFALLEAAVKVRRRTWRGREVAVDSEAWERFPDAHAGPAGSAETSELMAAVHAGIRDALTPRQRLVLVAVAIEGVPIDVLAERLGSNRGAIYKTLHDARRKLRERLAREGLMARIPHEEAAA